MREIGTFQEGKAPLLPPTLRRVLSAFEGERGAAAARDRALLLLGLPGGYRVSEPASLRVDDVELVDEGAIVVLRSSKTDQAGGGFYKGIPYGDHAKTCPVSHLEAWLGLLPTSPDGVSLFKGADRHGNLSGRPMVPDSISRVVKKRAQ